MTGESSYRNPLGYQPVGVLMKRLAIPAVVANVVNALYNVIDQIVIGQGIGFLGNAATNIAFPLTTICLALGLMIGIGSASRFNLEMGRKEMQKAKLTIGNATILLFGVGILICLLVRIFLEPLMLIFGATENILSYAMTFSGITSFGIPFLMFSMGFNPIVRADASPKYSMMAIVTGAVINTVLSPLFMFVFNWGIAGTAWATVISQFISALLLLAYFPRFKSVTLEKEDFKLDWHTIKSIVVLGLTPFVTQVSNIIIQVLGNNLLKQYGSQSVYGPDIPIAIAGIVMKVNVIFMAIVLGMVQGSQPIIGFNYGAKNFPRVRETFKVLMKSVAVVSVLAWMAFELLPGQLISLFGSGDSGLYLEFGKYYMRTFLFFSITNGFMISISTYFTSIGKAWKGTILSMLRQLILLIPLMILFARLFGVKGVMLGGPVSDFVTFIMAAIFIVIEFKRMPKENLSV
ncbi:MATE family efflux transporter [Streptococcus pluranimalium]|uniref:MATE family efflux transporter n=1 Tax=Streptococcus pluranimalium TaxID=82348 RepID=UPI002414FB41|nr:MATE family efflux transporter [Streptococcus pluranimalium]MDY3041497.1 MATE family efflux transporter [Streptococcus pluranimalium]WFM79024.1 MATE family efflux transporter [Streptococcus pluranimalium]HEM6115506.1 MATE family efflux transporter [Streptococcus suis]